MGDVTARWNLFHTVWILFSPESHKNLTTKEKNIKKLKGSHLSILLYSLRVTILFYFEPGTEFWRSFC